MIYPIEMAAASAMGNYPALADILTVQLEHRVNKLQGTSAPGLLI